MDVLKFTDNLDYALTICDREGIILYMNEKAKKTFLKWGDNLIGQNLLECHSEPARSKLSFMLKEEKKNVYTVEKNGIKKLIYQSPYYESGVYKGFYEISLEIPFDMDNFVRTSDK